MAAIEDDEVPVIILEEIMAAEKNLAPDHDLAFNLHMEEALAVSRAGHTSTVPESPSGAAAILDFTGAEERFDSTYLLLQDIAQAEHEMKRLKVDLDRRVYDEEFAKQIMNIPEGYWISHGYNNHKPYSLGASSSSSSSSSAVGNGDESFHIYCKGLVSEEVIGETKVMVGGFGVAICDSTNHLIWEVSKVLRAEDCKNPEIAELEALVSGLDEALNFDLGRVTFFIDHSKIFQYVTGKLKPRESNVATLVNQVAVLQRKFSYCQPSLLTSINGVNYVFKLARDAIVSQIKWAVETSQGKTYKETCVICFESINVKKMFSVDGCFHRFCLSCMEMHIVVKILTGKTASCPGEECKSEVNIECCKKFLHPNLVNIMMQRKKEGSIRVSQRVYCPYPKCSELMVKAELLEYSKKDIVNAEKFTARKCMKCKQYFCIQCKAPWHYDLTCDVFSKSKDYQKAGDEMFNSLAQKNRWRPCRKCNNMVELDKGCYHITCRCGNEFCYTCGKEWKKKKATCSCPIYDERNISSMPPAVP